MRSIRWLLLPLLVMAPGWSFAVEELSADKLVIQAKILRGGDFLGFGFDSLWMMSGGELVRASAADNSAADIELPGTIGKYRGIAVGEGAVWVPDVGAETIYKIDPASITVVGTFPTFILGSEGSVGAGEGAVWLTPADDHDKTLIRYNAATGAEEGRIALPGPGIGVVVDFGSVWVTGYQKGELYRVDPKTNTVTMTTKLHERPRFIASGENSIWVLNQGDGTFSALMAKQGNCSRRSKLAFPAMAATSSAAGAMFGSPCRGHRSRRSIPGQIC